MIVRNELFLFGLKNFARSLEPGETVRLRTRISLVPKGQGIPQLCDQTVEVDLLHVVDPNSFRLYRQVLPQYGPGSNLELGEMQEEYLKTGEIVAPRSVLDRLCGHKVVYSYEPDPEVQLLTSRF